MAKQESLKFYSWVRFPVGAPNYSISINMELVLLRPKRSENSKTTFHVHTKDNFKSKGCKKLGLYAKGAEEWCYNEDFEFYQGEKEK